MNHVYFFEYNIPASNQFAGYTTSYIEVIARWTEGSYYNDGRPIVTVMPVITHMWDCQKVKDWYLAGQQIEKIAQKHFSELSKHKEEPTGNPVLDRYTEKEKDLLIQETLS